MLMLPVVGLIDRSEIGAHPVEVEAFCVTSAFIVEVTCEEIIQQDVNYMIVRKSLTFI